MPTALINGSLINFVQLSEGPDEDREDLIMVHGLAANIAFWYFKYACELAKEYRVTVFDLRGHGRSEMTPSGYAPESLANDMLGLMDRLKIDKAHILAHSFGGVVAMNLAVRRPDRVLSLALADTHITAARHIEDSGEWAYGQTIQASMDAQGFDLDAQDPYFGYKLLTRVAGLQLAGKTVPPELEDLVHPLTGKTSGRTAAQWLRLMEVTSAEDEMMGDDGLTLEALRSFKFPILAMYGDQSPARLTGTELLEVWPHAEFRNVRNAGHFFPATRPGEVLSACRRFWRSGTEHSRPRIRDGEPRRGYFRSDRIFKDQLGWYFTTRELPRIGPFEEYDQAASVLHHAVLNNLIGQP